MDNQDGNRHLKPSRRGFITNLIPSRKGFIANYPNFQHWKKISFEARPDNEPINIYLHIPFCIQRCAYCYYRTTPLKGKKQSGLTDNYVKALCSEIEMASTFFNLKNRPVISVYFGGGTPTILNGEQFVRITECLKEHLNFDHPEFTVEGEPITLTQQKADILKLHGVNRISLGVQSFHSDILKLAKRLDAEDQVLKAIDIAKTTRSVINIDLLSGLAGETDQSWAYTIERALNADVESITIYKMELYANTVYYREVRMY